jgi:hypothetical protein
MAQRGWPLVLIALVWGATGLHSQGMGPPFRLVSGVELGASVNLTDRNVKAEGTLFLPTKTERARAVIVVMKHGPTEDLMLTGSNPYSVWHALSEEQSYGLLHLRVTPYAHRLQDRRILTPSSSEMQRPEGPRPSPSSSGCCPWSPNTQSWLMRLCCSGDGPRLPASGLRSLACTPSERLDSFAITLTFAASQ